MAWLLYEYSPASRAVSFAKSLCNTTTVSRPPFRAASSTTITSCCRCSSPTETQWAHLAGIPDWRPWWKFVLFHGWFSRNSSSLPITLHWTAITMSWWLTLPLIIHQLNIIQSSPVSSWGPTVIFIPGWQSKYMDRQILLLYLWVAIGFS